MAADYFNDLFTSHAWDLNSTVYIKLEKIKTELFVKTDNIEAVKECKFQKALGWDCFYGELLNDKEIGKNLRNQLVDMLRCYDEARTNFKEWQNPRPSGRHKTHGCSLGCY